MDVGSVFEIYYDGDCQMCCGVTKDWAKQDTTNDFRFYQSPSELGRTPTLPQGVSFGAQIVVRDDEGKFYYGAEALALIYHRLPGHTMAAWWWRTLVRYRVGDPMYSWIARHRQTLSIWWRIKDSFRQGIAALRRSS